MSRIGRKPIPVPKDVKIDIKERYVLIEGPKGKLERVLADRISLELKDNQIIVKRLGNISSDKALQGLTRALVANMIKGVTDGYVKEMEIIGVGYKAAIQGNNLSMHLRFSHPVVFSIPEGITITTPKPTQIVVSGIDKEKVGEIAAEIRSVCPPEPYKGKGIRFVGEYVRKKVGKAQAATK
jgi:large subunit ribosomal protein L6